MTRRQLSSNVDHDLRGPIWYRVLWHRACVGGCGHYPPFPVAREVMANQCSKFLCVIPERDFRALIEDSLNVIGPPMQEEALRRGQFVGASAVLVAGLALPAYHEFSLHRRNRDPS